MCAPVLQLQPAYTCAYQFYLSEKLRDEMKHLISGIYHGVQEYSAGPSANCVLRERKNFLTLDCKRQRPTILVVLGPSIRMSWEGVPC